MSDLISRKVAIDALAEHEKSKGHNYTFFVDVVRECAEIIRDLPSAQQWTPVSEGPPEEEKDVLITKEPFKIKGYEQNVIIAERSADPRSGKIEWWSPEYGTLTN